MDITSLRSNFDRPETTEMKKNGSEAALFYVEAATHLYLTYLFLATTNT
jgi:hypothetical protein